MIDTHHIYFLKQFQNIEFKAFQFVFSTTGEYWIVWSSITIGNETLMVLMDFSCKKTECLEESCHETLLNKQEFLRQQYSYWWFNIHGRGIEYYCKINLKFSSSQEEKNTLKPKGIVKKCLEFRRLSWNACRISPMVNFNYSKLMHLYDYSYHF